MGIIRVKHIGKKIIIGFIGFCSFLTLFYVGVALFFMNHFYVGSEINGIDVSGKSIESAEDELAAVLQNYSLTLKERVGRIEEITAQDIGLKYVDEHAVKKYKSAQSPLAWILSLFKEEGYKISVEITYNKDMLKERIDKLNCLDQRNIIEPQNPSIKFDGIRYVIIPEEHGNKIDKDILFKYVKDAIVKQETTIDLEVIGCYFRPEFTSESQKVIRTVEELNKIVSTKLTYKFGDQKEVLDGTIINKWISINEDYEVIIEEENIKTYVNSLAYQYNTLGKPIDFKTSSGNTIKVSSGDYGWVMDVTKETEAINTAIKKGETIEREPIYSKSGRSRSNNGIGNTYVEVDMANQHVWFYKDGILITEGPTVTGNVRAGHTTPEGIYSLKYKQRDTVLRGPGYASPVSFWMPFNGGIGLHDASWRNRFGGNIYKTDGSHGCINLQYNVAKEIYNNIEAGIPVICHNNR
ncbi:L,D-transpeptidase family protein [Clostridium thermarum]|uniref:L,D-transpeptidase family protein n=1 Tax=Clostridium thermarum TaxID=1716543 RepID=UPI0013D81CEA|nr:peptidoglycan binding domain-containing protein [Clostridium thermarum]